jgi:hypothetical protein
VDYDPSADREMHWQIGIGERGGGAGDHECNEREQYGYRGGTVLFAAAVQCWENRGASAREVGG